MANWVYPLGTAADGCWDISLGTADSSLNVEGWAHTGLKVATLAAGAVVRLPAAKEERIIIPLNGSFSATVEDVEYQLSGRATVFHGPSDVLYSGTGRAATVTSSAGGRVAVATAHAKSTTSGPRRHWKQTGSSCAK
jgi:5-deoxy-glucuronate isomerase